MKKIILHIVLTGVYTSYSFKSLAKKGMTTSMFHKRNYRDNALIKSFYSSSKLKLSYSQEKQFSHDYTEYYDTERIQTKLDYPCPIDIEAI